MARQRDYSSFSIIDLNKDTPVETSGTVSVVNTEITLTGVSRAVYEYDYNTTSNPLSAESLQFIFFADSSLATRYAADVYVCFYVTYWQETKDEGGNVTGYEEGATDSFTLYPYMRSEAVEVGIPDTNIYTLYLQDLQIKKIRIEYTSISETETVKYIDPSLNQSVSVSQAISEAVGFDISLERVDWYTNGFRLTYANTSNEDRFYWNGDEHDNLNGINVNGEKLIYMETHNELLD